MKNNFEKLRNKKGHIVIPCVRSVVVEKLGGLGICDYCNETDKEGFLIPVLGHKWYCRSCKEEWEETSRYYPEDASYEESVTMRLLSAITLNKSNG